MNLRYFIEMLTPKQDAPEIEIGLEKFAKKYQAIMDTGYVISITDNPMGNLHFQATEVISELGLEVKPEQFLLHLNTFHTKKHLDEIMKAVEGLGAKYILAITGDGNERLPKLPPAEIGFNVNSATSVELMKYIEREFPGRFTLGVAFNPYEPQDHELEKMKRKVDAGAKFIITQPVIGKDDRLDALRQFNLPVIVDAWMSKKLHLLSQCVGYEIPENTPYDPIENLKALRQNYPAFGLYFALLNMEKQMPLVKPLL
jgi:methylenetetrahydrofolate reductase (NADPH)